MSLQMYLDSACTQQFFAHQSFPGNGSTSAFALTNFTGAQLGSVYKETQTTTSGISFASGVGSGFSGLTANALIGQRVVHNGIFQGTVVANAATTVTISNAAYSGSAGPCVLSSYVKLALGTGYTVSGSTLSVTSTPAANQNIIAAPLSDLSANFGGGTGAVKTTQTPFWLRRSPITGGGSLNTYDTLQVQSVDLSVAQASLTQSGVTFASGVGSGFSALVAGALIGRAVNHNGVFVGTVTANTTTTVTISNTAYSNATASESVVYTVGSLQFAADVSGSPGVYAPVINPSAINSDTAVKVWVQDTVTVPTTAMNYPNNVIVVTGIEYLA